MEEIKKCCQPHPMYGTLTCHLDYGHEGLHKIFYNYELLRWGIPSFEELYESKRTK